MENKITEREDSDSEMDDVPLLYKLIEFVPDMPGSSYYSGTTGCAGREDEYDD